MIIDRLKSAEISVVFGTHALIEPDICFNDLSLVIIDEQQRFGVEQRNKLLDKNPTCDFLSMTATPIPRSLALVIYGDITTSYLDSRPMSAVITTKMLDGSRVNEAYEQVRSALVAGNQAFIVCPLISMPGQKPESKTTKATGQKDDLDQEEPEQLIDSLFEFEDGEHIKAAEQELIYLQNKVFPNAKIALLTSKLSNNDKQEVMQGFRNGQIDILVSTTVIEVGVDVPNATVMIIQDAERFGLAQLHQLRGRVGRGSCDAQVFLITRSRKKQALERLKLLEQIADGLKLAEQDLLMRREGDIAGVRQSGEAALTLINVVRDAELINQAHQDCQELLRIDPNLDKPENQFLKYELNAIKQRKRKQQ
jgi:ATP-dependent DNA helicase RecG